MEFLVEIHVQWPPDGDPERRAALVAAESKRARELAAAGIMKRIWRAPGEWKNVGLWETEDATALHDAIASLPFYPWLKMQVRPMAAHPNDPQRRTA